MRRVFVLAILLLGVGCSSFYEHSIQTDRYSLYGNHDLERLRNTGEFLDESIRAFRLLFPERQSQVPPPRVIYDEDELSRLRIFTPEVRQEGYYFPWFQLIHLSPREYSSDQGGFGQSQRVILHELAHHFILNAYPKSSSRYWLNEGLACALETSFMDAEAEFVAPLYHSWLHQQAHRRLRDQGPEQVGRDLLELIHGNWFHFHSGNDKVYHYAISWALTYHLMARVPGSVEQRVATVIELTPPEIERRLPGFLRWLGLSPEIEIERLVERAELAQWGLLRWLELPTIRTDRLLSRVAPWLDAPSATPQRTAGMGVLAELVARPETSQQIPLGTILELEKRLIRELEFGATSEQLAIARALRTPGETSPYTRPLVQLLESESPELRVAAAQALSRISSKRTITRPDFWRGAPVDERNAEILEWEIWLRERGR